MNYKKYEKL